MMEWEEELSPTIFSASQQEGTLPETLFLAPLEKFPLCDLNKTESHAHP